jgi:serine/threonine protein kinase
MWEYIPQKIKGFSAINKTDLSVFETSTRVGTYNINHSLGTGQFAEVKMCTDTRTGKQCAVKSMKKEKVCARLLEASHMFTHQPY